MKNFLSLLLLYFLFITSAQTEIVNKLSINNNNRISDETIITYGQIEIGKNYMKLKLMKF